MGNLPHGSHTSDDYEWCEPDAVPHRPGRNYTEVVNVAVVSLKEILDRAFSERYGVAAFNILNDLTVEAIVEAATVERARVILQTSVKTVRQYGRGRLMGILQTLVR